VKPSDPSLTVSTDEAARVRALFEPLRSAPVSVPDAETAQAERDALLPFIERGIADIPEQRAARERARRRAWLMAAAGAVLVLGGSAVGVHRFWGGGNTTALAGSQFSDSGAFVGDAAFTTPTNSSARVVTEGGVRVDVAPATRARVVASAAGANSAGPNAAPAVEKGARVDLFDGSVTLDVPKQAPGSSVRVITPEATVTVHGTHFTVAYDARSESRLTCVRVEHGKVSVERRTAEGLRSEVLTDGQSSGCADSASAPGAEAATAQAATEGVTGARAVPAPGSRTGSHAPGARSTLAQENALLRDALAAEQSGDFARAERKLRLLVSKYPQSSLSQEARRALSRVEKERAAR
jgi:hypothetical protein